MELWDLNLDCLYKILADLQLKERFLSFAFVSKEAFELAFSAPLPTINFQAIPRLRNSYGNFMNCFMAEADAQGWSELEAEEVFREAFSSWADSSQTLSNLDRLSVRRLENFPLLPNKLEVSTISTFELNEFGRLFPALQEIMTYSVRDFLHVPRTSTLKTRENGLSLEALKNLKILTLDFVYGNTFKFDFGNIHTLYLHNAEIETDETLRRDGLRLTPPTSDFVVSLRHSLETTGSKLFNLNGNFMVDISTMNGLIEADLSVNNFDDIRVLSKWQRPSLRKLTLTIHGEVDSLPSLNGLPNLHILSIKFDHHMIFKGNLDPFVQPEPNLQELTLHFQNGISNLEAFRHQTNLSNLVIYHSTSASDLIGRPPLSSVTLKVLPVFKRLSSLTLFGHCDPRKLALALRELELLTSFSLQSKSTDMEDGLPLVLHSLKPRLQSLTLIDIAVSLAAMDVIGRLLELRSLSITEMDPDLEEFFITDEWFTPILQLSQLETLNLGRIIYIAEVRFGVLVDMDLQRQDDLVRNPMIERLVESCPRLKCLELLNMTRCFGNRRSELAELFPHASTVRLSETPKHPVM